MSDDYEELCRYKLAADSGDAVAHYHLHFFYAKGRGGLLRGGASKRNRSAGGRPLSGSAEGGARNAIVVTSRPAI